MIIKKNVSPRFNRLFACFIVLVFLVIVQLMAKDTTSTSADSRTAGELGELEQATFGAGCFWCVEAVFETLDGVESVVSGYMGGETLNPTYESICTGLTGHAEVVQIHFKPEVITYEALLKRFWLAHDPTTLNRQGADVGTQYRSAIFTHLEEQAKVAEASMAEASNLFAEPIVTQIAPADTFYPAENYHQDFYRTNKRHPYCQMVIRPKLKKLDGDGAMMD